MQWDMHERQQQKQVWASSAWKPTHVRNITSYDPMWLYSKPHVRMQPKHTNIKCSSRYTATAKRNKHKRLQWWTYCTHTCMYESMYVRMTLEPSIQSFKFQAACGVLCTNLHPTPLKVVESTSNLCPVLLWLVGKALGLVQPCCGQGLAVLGETGITQDANQLLSGHTTKDINHKYQSDAYPS